MADNKQMKLKIEYDNINTAEKPIQSLVNFFTNNSTLRMLKRENSDPTEITDSESFWVPADEDHWCMNGDETEISLFLGEGYNGFNGKCKWVSITFTPEVEPVENQDVVINSTNISLDGFDELEIKNGTCSVQSEKLEEVLSEFSAEWVDVSKVEVQLTHKIETNWTANIINDAQLENGKIGIASIKYENKSGEVEGESIDSALVQKNGTNPIIDCDTKFVKANTALKFYTMDSEIAEESEDAEFSEVEVVPIPMMKIPVTITPYYNGKENTDADIIPKFVDDSGTENVDESIIQNYKIPKNDLPVDWKLRTTTFTLQYGEGENERCEVFYKVGFCPADGKETIEKEVINALKVYTFTIEDNNFTLEYPEWAACKFDFPAEPQCHITGKPVWLPVYQHDEFCGIVYIELYKSNDGSKFESSVLDDKEYNVCVEFDENAYSNFYAPLKDYMLDKGNISSVYNEVPS